MTDPAVALRREGAPAGLRQLWRRAVLPVVDALAARLSGSGGGTGHDADADKHAALRLLIQQCARGVAASGDHRVLLPTGAGSRRGTDPFGLRIALCGNMANNAYATARAMRRLGYQADALVCENFFDDFVMSRPAWEEVEVEADSYAEALVRLPAWEPPPFVRNFTYDPEFGLEFCLSLPGAAAARRLYAERCGVELPEDVGFLLAQMMSHWPYIAALADYDIAVFMAGPMMLAPFCPIPFACYPVGGDRFITPFQENLPGLLTRAGYRRSSAVFMSAPHFSEWYDRLGVTDRCALSDYFIDTDSYHPGDEPELRREWSERVGGDTFIVSTCRQSWPDKGNDRVIAAFARLAPRYPGLRLVFVEWGDDVARSRSLAARLGVGENLLWLKLASKPLTARRQRAADIIVDQLVMASFGTCIMESMAAAKPVIARQDASDMAAPGYEPPPIVAAASEEEVVVALERCLDPDFCRERGEAGRRWMLHWCSHETKAGRFAEQLATIVDRARGA